MCRSYLVNDSPPKRRTPKLLCECVCVFVSELYVSCDGDLRVSERIRFSLFSDDDDVFHLHGYQVFTQKWKEKSCTILKERERERERERDMEQTKAKEEEKKKSVMKMYIREQVGVI